MSSGAVLMRTIATFLHVPGDPALFGNPSPQGLKLGELRDIYSNGYRLQNPFQTPDSANPPTIARAFRNVVVDKLLYEARSLLVARTKIQQGYLDHDAFRVFGRSELIYREYVRPAETLDQIISEACRQAGGEVENALSKASTDRRLPPALYPVLGAVAEDTRQMIDANLDALVAELYCLSMLGRYFFATPFEEIDTTISKVQRKLGNIQEQLLWCNPFFLGVSPSLDSIYRQTESLWNRINKELSFFSPLTWGRVYELPEYKAAQKTIATERVDVDELLSFMIMFRVNKDYLIKDLDLGRVLAERELQALKMARDLGAALTES